MLYNNFFERNVDFLEYFLVGRILLVITGLRVVLYMFNIIPEKAVAIVIILNC
jgi:hypothetical protein